MTQHVFIESQKFKGKLMYFVFMLLGSILALFIYADVQQLILGRPFGEKPAPNAVLITATLFLSFLFFALIATTLETTVTQKDVTFRWRPFQKKVKQFNWSDIAKAEIVHYGFVGYGLRVTSHGLVYTAGGNAGLKLVLKSGRKIIIGTQRPEELEEVLAQLKIEN
ncbi:hypothetical protein [Pinibacter aurantiacus]|uniref:Uncharacterized protein n=1 Tax=Pinibacter aurantiacus TaxID=2851599 RepID=A0A9E2S713_9BACT|nr:hypothetical protein [Pinibacter aurantiacus]MBV4355614.1 hypothetical protein [Pinibacter aurantiacus]